MKQISRQQPPQLFGGDEARAEPFALPPHQRAHPENFAAGHEGEAEQFRHRQRADAEANALVGSPLSRKINNYRWLEPNLVPPGIR